MSKRINLNGKILRTDLSDIHIDPSWTPGTGGAGGRGWIDEETLEDKPIAYGPLSDMVEVVRCENCNFYRMRCYCSYFQHEVNPSGYCSRGEARRQI